MLADATGMASSTSRSRCGKSTVASASSDELGTRLIGCGCRVPLPGGGQRRRRNHGSQPQGDLVLRGCRLWAAAAWRRLVTPSLRRMFDTWTLAVFSLM